MTKEQAAKGNVILSMVIFGTIGLFVRNIALPSSVISLARGVCGVVFLLVVMFIRRTGVSWAAVRNNLLWLCLSGAGLGFNWVLLFEAFHYTTVATATLCYYMAPMLIILVSPFILRERLTARKILCVIAALAGMVCISGVLEHGMPAVGEMKGILFGLAAAVLYACVVLINKRMRGISAYERTILQLGISAVIMLPYCLITVPVESLRMDLLSVVMLLIVGSVHTGLAYFLYFGAIEAVPAQTAAIISYVDPVVALLVSALILAESMGIPGWIGAALILGAALVSELRFCRRGCSA